MPGLSDMGFRKTAKSNDIVDPLQAFRIRALI